MVKCIIFLTLVIFCAIILVRLSKDRKESHQEVFQIKEPFSVADYLERMERAHLDILKKQEPVDMTIILWLGLDGLTLDENRELKRVSRKKPKPVNQNTFYQPCQTIKPMPTSMFATTACAHQYNLCQNTRSTINALHYQNTRQQIQAAQQVMMQNLMTQAQSCCVQAPMPGYLRWPY